VAAGVPPVDARPRRRYRRRLHLLPLLHLRGWQPRSGCPAAHESPSLNPRAVIARRRRVGKDPRFSERSGETGDPLAIHPRELRRSILIETASRVAIDPGWLNYSRFVRH